jgi:hypothetical protein
VVDTGVPGENHRPWASNWYTLSLAAASRVHPFLSFTKLGANPRRIDDRLLVNDKKGCTRLAAARDKVYQLLAHGRWFSPGTPVSTTNKTDRHDKTEILLKVALTPFS